MASHSLAFFTMTLVFLGLTACQSQEISELARSEDVYSLPNTDKDVPQNMKMMSPSDLDKGGILKCDGLDDHKKYVYARFEIAEGKVNFSYVGSISGKYQVFHDVLISRATTAKLDFKGEKTQIDLFEQGSSKAFLSLKVDSESSHDGDTEATAKLSYENKNQDVAYKSIEVDCVAFRHLER